MSLDNLGWQTIENEIVERAENNASGYSPKPGKRIRRRTRILNKKLKQFASLKSYSQYVRIKTKILRWVSEGEDSEEEECDSIRSSDNEAWQSEVSFDDDEPDDVCCSGSADEENNENEAENGANKENSRLAFHTETKERSRAKKHLTISSDNLETRKSTDRIDEIVGKRENNDNNDACNNNSEKISTGKTRQVPIVKIPNAPPGDSGIDDDSQDVSSSINRETIFTGLEIVAGTNDENNFPPEETDETEETIEEEKNDESPRQKENEEQPIFDDDEQSKKKSQPIITSTEILKSKYKIIRDETEKDCSEDEELPLDQAIIHTDEGSIEPNETSPESKRVSELKRINLLCYNSDSDTSDSDYTNGNMNESVVQNPTKMSQGISGLSDSEDLSNSSSFHITDTDESDFGEAIEHQAPREEKSLQHREAVAPTVKSIKDQIEEQRNNSWPIVGEESDDSTIEMVEVEESPARERCFGNRRRNEDDSKQKNHVSSDVDALRYILKKHSQNRCDQWNLLNSASSLRDDDNNDKLPENDENLSRPIELQDFVEREGLTPASELSTITIRDIAFNQEEDEQDEEILVMEIPKSIMDNRELCGKRIVFDKTMVRIGDASYRTSQRPEKSVSCILRSKRKKSRYKAVNIRSVCSIIIHAESIEKESLAEASESRESRMKVGRAEKAVPFPKNIKLRNPLTMENRSCEHSKFPLKNSISREKIRTEKRKRNGVWDINRFVLKSKKPKTDFPWNGEPGSVK